MPQIGWFELLLIVIIAVLVIGPKDFPVVLRKIGSWIGSIKKYFSDMQSGMNEITNFIDFDEEDKNFKYKNLKEKNEK